MPGRSSLVASLIARISLTASSTFDQPHRAGGLVAPHECRAGRLDLDRESERAEPVAVPPVDPALRGVQHLDELAAIARVVELPPHELRVDAPPPMRRPDAHGGHEADLELATRHRHRHRERTRRARRSPPPSNAAKHRSGSAIVRSRSISSSGRALAERELGRAEECGELVLGDRSDLQVHPTSLRARQALEEVGEDGVARSPFGPGDRERLGREHLRPQVERDVLELGLGLVAPDAPRACARTRSSNRRARRSSDPARRAA